MKYTVRRKVTFRIRLVFGAVHISAPPSYRSSAGQDTLVTKRDRGEDQIDDDQSNGAQARLLKSKTRNRPDLQHRPAMEAAC